jgi:hypothetical protein
MGAKDIAKKLGGSRAAGGGNYIKQGKGRLIVKSLKHEDLYAGETFIAELYVERSESFPGAINPTTKEPELANPPGSSASFIQQFKQFPETAFAMTKGFLLTLLGEDDSTLAKGAAERVAKGQVPEEWCKAENKPAAAWSGADEFGLAYENVVSKANPCRGMALDYETYTKPTKKGDKILVLPRFTHVKQTPDEIAARRAAFDGAEPK